jgi:hypothetical protein
MWTWGCVATPDVVKTFSTDASVGSLLHLKSIYSWRSPCENPLHYVDLCSWADWNRFLFLIPALDTALSQFFFFLRVSLSSQDWPWIWGLPPKCWDYRCVQPVAFQGLYKNIDSQVARIVISGEFKWNETQKPKVILLGSHDGGCQGHHSRSLWEVALTAISGWVSEFTRLTSTKCVEARVLRCAQGTVTLATAQLWADGHGVKNSRDRFYGDF